ncbi:MAG: response regulator [Bacilli bacterium]|nr:response regulator [Bacilli bacterium]
MTNLYIPACAFFVSALMLLIFYSRENLETTETKTFSYMLVASFLDIILTLSIMYIGYTNVNIPDLVIFLNRIDYLMLITWVSSFAYYIFYITFKNHPKMNFAKIAKTVKYADVVFFIFMFLLPVELFNDGVVMYAYGAAVNVLYLVCFISILVIATCLVYGHKNLFTKKYMPVYVLIVLMILTLVIRGINPGLIIIPAVICYINLILLLTIENPDIKIIALLSEAKKKAEKYANDKEIFTFNMSQKIKEPVNNIEYVCDKIINEDNIDKIKAGLESIKLSTQKVTYLVNDSLNISTSNSKFKIVEKQYKLDNLLKEITLFSKNKAKDKNVTFNFYMDNKPKMLVGDSLKIKQVMIAFTSNLFSKLEEKHLSLNISTKDKEETCNIIFKYAMAKINISLDDLNKSVDIDDFDNIDLDRANLAHLKKMVNLLGGYLEVKNEDENKTEIIITLEQKKTFIEDEKELEFINEYEKMVKTNPKILIIDDDKNSAKELEKNIDKYNYDIVVASGGQEGLELIRSKEDVSLIFIDDTLEKLDTITTFTKLKIIEDFKIPVIYVGEVNDEKEVSKLLQLGFKDVLLKPVKLKEIDELIKKYLK